MKYFYLLFIVLVGSLNSANAIERTVNNVSELRTAIASSVAGDVVLINGVNYVFTTRLDVKNKNGTASNRIVIKANPASATRPKFDFSAMAESSSNQGILIENSSYLHIIGIDVYKAGDNGMLIKNSHNNIIEFCTFSECFDSGLQISNASANNLILNCDSYYNADSGKENADGFACKMDVGTGNTFRGCRAWQNLDDGWDGYLRGSDNITTIYENCWAFDNGKLKNGSISGGDGNGFKTGGSDGKDLKHNAILKNCIVAGNINKGFDHNNNRGEVTIYNGAASGNGVNIRFNNTNRVSKLTIKNTLVFGSRENLYADVSDITHNSWNSSPAITVNAASFESVDISELKKPRKSDGSLPDVNYLRPVSGSSLINRGVDVGLPYIGSAPDIGAFEYDPSLPLDFLAFDAKIDPLSGYAVLTWITANELNTQSFVIERSRNGETFEPIGDIAAKNTSGINNYNFTDESFLSGKAYYRLKQTDKDGLFNYSKITVVYAEPKTFLTASPNPVNDIVKLVYPQINTGGYIHVTDLGGRKVYGLSLTEKSVETAVNLSHLQKGIYIVTFHADGGQQTLKLIKE